MDARELIKELGLRLGIALELSDENTCQVIFDKDEVDFEVMDGFLWAFADLGYTQHRADAYKALLAGNLFGLKSGKATLALDEERDMFTLQMELWGGVPYEVFEARLTQFVEALRWWKDWLNQPVEFDPAADEPAGYMDMIRV